jgi:hypothetical protein
LELSSTRSYVWRLSIPWILAITNKFPGTAHEQNALISSAMEAYQASPEMTKAVESSPFLMPSARNSLQRIRSAAGKLGNKDPANGSAHLPVNFTMSPFQRKDFVNLYIKHSSTMKNQHLRYISPFCLFGEGGREKF